MDHLNPYRAPENLADDQPRRVAPQADPLARKWGMASLIVCGAAVCVSLVLFGLGWLLTVLTQDSNQPLAPIGLVIALVAHIMGVACGVRGVTASGRASAMPWVGIVCNVLAVLFHFGLMWEVIRLTAE